MSTPTTSTERERHIAHVRNYCVHYKPLCIKKRCAAGMDISRIQSVATKEGGLRWGPCIEGHLLPNVCSLCPKWERTSQEDAEKDVDEVDAMFNRMTKVGPVVAAWRQKEPRGKSEIITCPACGGKLHLSQAACNGHVHGHCETKGCVSWME